MKKLGAGNPENVYYHAVQNVLSSSMLSEKVEVKTYKTVISTTVLNGSAALPLK
jgi:hypothetical protein